MGVVCERGCGVCVCLGGASFKRSDQVAANVIWDAVSIQRQDVEVCSYAGPGVAAPILRVAVRRVLTVPVDRFVEAEECRSGGSEARDVPCMRRSVMIRHVLWHVLSCV